MTRSDVELEPMMDSLNDVMLIHNSPVTVSQKQSLSPSFTNELILRGLSVDGALEMRRERLQHSLKGNEATIERLSKEFRIERSKKARTFY